MKTILFTVCLLCSLTSIAQSELYPCKFKVLDAQTHKPVPNVLVTIVQGGFKTIESDVNGFCDFKAIPVGRIDVTASHQDYRHIKLQYNVSSEIKNNTFIIELIPNSESSLLVTGKVEDEIGAEIANISVEVKVDGRPFKTTTDESGNYQVDIPLKTFRSERVQLQLRKGNCKYSEEIIIPEKRYI